jgi:hypothetical protein
LLHVVGLSSLLFDPRLNGILPAIDDNVRTALMCWGIVLSGFFVLRVPREVLLGCLVAAFATVGLAAVVIDTAPVQATAASAKQVPHQSYVRFRAAPSASEADHSLR